MTTGVKEVLVIVENIYWMSPKAKIIILKIYALE